MRSLSERLSKKKKEDLDKPYQFKDKSVPDEALAQDTFWYDKSGKLYKISEMNGSHARNSAKYLARTMWNDPKLHDYPLMKALVERAHDEEERVRKIKWAPVTKIKDKV